MIDRIKRSMFVCMQVVLLTTLLRTTSVAHAASFTCGTWNIVASPSPGLSLNHLYAVATISANDAWAVGNADNTATMGQHQTLTEHWNGTKWAYVKSPNVVKTQDFLNGVAAISTSDVWAVGYYINSSVVNQTLIEHWNGTSWKIVPSPNVGTDYNQLNGVVAISSSNVWAVGFYRNAGVDQTLIEHWNGATWSVVTSPNNGTGINVLNGVAATSASDIWAIGYYYNSSIQQTLALHYDGTGWSVVTSPNPGGSKTVNTLNAVAAVSSSDVWAVGYYQFNGNFVTLIEQWNGAGWSVVPSPNVGTFPIANYLNGIVAISASDIWAVGDDGNFSNGSTVKTLTEQWNGASWNIVTSPNGGTTGDNLYAAAAVDASHVWAVGAYATNGGNGLTDNKTLSEFYC